MSSKNVPQLKNYVCNEKLVLSTKLWNKSLAEHGKVAIGISMRKK